MKKLFLLTAVVASAFTINAQDFSEYFKVSVEGKTLENGATAVFTEADEFGTIDAKIRVENITDQPRKVYGMLRIDKTPSLAQYTDYSAGWGTISFCYEFADGSGNCLMGDDNNQRILGKGTIEVPANDYFIWDIHNYSKTNAEQGIYKLEMTPFEGEEELPVFFDAYVAYGASAGVSAVEFDENLPIQYFDLAGRQVVNPENGIYILKQGSKVEKRIIK